MFKKWFNKTVFIGIFAEIIITPFLGHTQQKNNLKSIPDANKIGL